MRTNFEWLYGSLEEGSIDDFHIWPKELNISDDAISELEGIRELAGIEWKLEIIVAMNRYYGERQLASKYTKNVVRARDSLEQFVGAMDVIGPWGARAILSAERQKTLGGKEYQFQEQDDAYHLKRFVELANRYLSVIDKYLEPLEPKNGRSVNYTARLVSRQVAEAFWDADKHLTTYYDSAYMQTLRIILAEVMPQIGEEAHRRHGKWAIGILKTEGTK